MYLTKRKFTQISPCYDTHVNMTLSFTQAMMPISPSYNAPPLTQERGRQQDGACLCIASSPLPGDEASLCATTQLPAK